MQEIKLGKLEKIHDLRIKWKNEEHDFTPWLADNIDLLAEKIGISIKVITKEAPVGKFYVDILAVDTDTNENIIIENQLEVTDHDHLGKILVYGAGYDAKTIIWVVKDINEEHKQAIEWLNEHSDESINLFLLKLELCKIGDSELAPNFEIISQPNDWTKVLRNNSSNSDYTETKLLYLNFWEGFKKYCDENRINMPRKAQAKNYYNVSIGSKECGLVLYFPKQGGLACQLYIDNNKDLFNNLYNKKDKIESSIGYPLMWDYKETHAASSIDYIVDFNVDLNKDDFTKEYEWYIKKIEEFKATFKKYL